MTSPMFDPQLRSELETAIGSIWAEALAVEAVAPEDNFFERGGHSLSALQVLNEVEERLGIELSGIEDLWEHPTLAGFAALVGSQLPGPDRATPR